MPLLFDFIDRQFIHNSPPTPTVSFEGKTVIVTGASSGLGLEATRLLVTLGAQKVIMCCRDTAKGNIALQDIQTATACSPGTLEIWKLDMSSFASITSFASRVDAELPRLDAALLNAGIATRTFNLTEGNEETITTNVISTALLAFLLYPKLHATAVRSETPAYITLTASELYEVAAFEESKVPTGQMFDTLSDESTANMNDRYNVSKLLEIIIVKQLSAMAPLDQGKVIINCVAPGFCQSNLHAQGLGRVMTPIANVLVRLLARPTAVGARTLVWGASAGVESHGQYLPDCKITTTKGLTTGDGGAVLQQRVWDELKTKLESIVPGVTTIG